MLPLYPAIAILLAGCIDTHRLSRTRWMEYGTFWWFAVPALVSGHRRCTALRYEGDFGWRAWPFLAASVVFGLRAWWLYDVDGAERSMLRACAAAILLAMGTFWGVIPSLTSLFPSDAVARAVHASECPSPQVAAVGFSEPSLVFQLGTDTQFTDAAGAASFLTARALPFRRRRCAAGPAIRAPRGSPRAALRQGHAVQRLLDRKRIAHRLHDLQFARRSLAPNLGAIAPPSSPRSLARDRRSGREVSSRPIWKRRHGPPGAQGVAVR